MTSAIFDNLLLMVRTHAKPHNPLIDCLKFIAKQLKIPTHQWDEIQNLSTLSFSSLEDYEKIMGIVFHPSGQQSLDRWPTSDYPVLIEDMFTGSCYVFLKKKGKKPLLFNPVTAQDEYLVAGRAISIKRSWQCMPDDILPQGGYVGLIKFTLYHFKKNYLNAILLGGLVSAASLIVSILSCFILSYRLEAHIGYNVVLYSVVFLFCMGAAWLYYASGLFVKSLNANILYVILPSMVNHILNLPLQVTKRFASSDLSQRLFDYEKAVLVVMRFTLSILFNCTGLVILLIYMIYCSVQLAFLYLIICIIFTVIKIGFFPKSIKNLTSQLLENSKLNAFLVEILLKIHILRSAVDGFPNPPKSSEHQNQI